MSGIPRRFALVGLAAGAAPLIATGVSCGRARAEFESGPSANVRDHGAVGDGVTDDTAAIEAAFTAGDGGVYFPKGTYVYNGDGLANAYPTVIGEGWNETRIILGSSSYLLNISDQMASLNVRGFKTSGGKGVIKYTYGGSNVIRKYSVRDCEFNDYAECAIASDAADMPYWIIRNCFFNSRDTLNTIGIALGGGTDQCIIDSCSFVRNRVHIKARLGNNMQINNCDFLQYSTENVNGPRASVWIIPGSLRTNSGPGFVLRNSKFGNENLAPGDHRILYADELPGATNGVRMPNLASDSEGFIVGHRITDCIFMNISNADHSVVFSTTPNVYGLAISDCYDDGSAYLLEFRTPPSVPNVPSTLNVFGPINGIGTSGAAGLTRLSNGIGVGYADDPSGVMPDPAIVRGSGSSAAYQDLLSAGADAFFPSAEASATPASDAFGGANAAIFTLATDAEVYRPLLAFTPGLPVFVEFDLKSPSETKPMEQLRAYVRDNNGAYHWSRVVGLPSVEQGWVTYQFHFVPRTPGATRRLHFSNAGGSAGSVLVGRPRAYHGSASQLGGKRPKVLAEAATPEETRDLVNDLRAKLIELGVIS